MTIYTTPFNNESTGLSVDSGLVSIDQVIELMGDDYLERGKPWVVYGNRDGDRVIFSNFVIREVG